MDGSTLVRHPWAELNAGALPEAVRGALHRLATAPQDLAELTATIPTGLPTACFAWLLTELRPLLVEHLCQDDRVLLSFLRTLPGAEPAEPAVDGPRRLSESAYLRRQGEHLALESADAPFRVLVHDPELATDLLHRHPAVRRAQEQPATSR